MGDTTGISWTDHTFNSWWGCTKIAPGCDNCYAATLDARTGGDYWDPKKAPRRTKQPNWKKVLKWNEQAEIENRRHKVFCGSMMDWCDNAVPDEWRDDLWELIRATPHLDWQLLTKRATRIEACLPADWGDGYPNVWLGVTVEDMEFGYPRINALRRIPAAVRFISAEPLLSYLFEVDLSGIDWVIIGGESGPGYRPMNPEWASHLRFLCAVQAIPVWFKQWGGNTADKGGCQIWGREIKEFPRPRLLPEPPL